MPQSGRKVVGRIAEQRTDEKKVIDITKERAKRERRPPSKPLIVFYLLLAGFIIAATSYYIVNRDSMTPDTIHRLLESASIPFGGSADSFAYDQEQNNVFAAYKDGLAVLSRRRLAVYDQAGDERMSQSVEMRDPVLRAARNALLCFDRGGETLLLIKDYRLEKELTFPNGIITARANARGQFAVLYREYGYPAKAGVYDADGELSYRFDSGEQYLLDCSLSPDGTRLAVATVKQERQTLTGGIRIFDTGADTPEPVGEYSRADELPVAVLHKNADTVLSLWENALVILDGDGLPVGRYEWPGRLLRGFSFDGDAVVLQLSRFETNGGSELVLLDLAGEVLRRQSFAEDIISVGAAGSYIALLTHDSVAVYDTELTLQGSSAVASGTMRALQRDDGSVLLLGASGASILRYYDVLELEP